MILNVDIYKTGTVCIEHFNEQDLQIKSNGEIRLKKGSKPTINVNEVNQPDLTSLVNSEHQLFLSSSTVHVFHRPDMSDRSDPMQSLERDCCKKAIAKKESLIHSMRSEFTHQKQQYENKIQIMEEKINELKRKIQTLHNRSYCLEKAKLKLKSALLDLQKSQIDPKLVKVLEV